MTRDALGSDRMIGMVQPMAEEERGAPPPAVYATGCAGRITTFSETDDGRFLITLTGVARFEIAEEMATTRGYRRVVPRWDRFAADLAEAKAGAKVDRQRLLNGLRAFFKLHTITADWAAIESTPDERLVTSLAMICPFAPSEKQALLEAPDLTERSRIMIALIEMAALRREGDDAPARH
jgi:Lon protease-like protein